MASDIVYGAVRAFLTANWSTSPIAWENEPFDRPEPPAPWVLVEVYGDSYAQASIGAGVPSVELWREQGAVLLHVFAPAGSGSATARQQATALADLLRGLELPGAIRFRDMSIGTGGPADDSGAWWMLTVRAAWLRN